MIAVSAKGRVAVVTLGCAKNQVDSELMRGFLVSDGYELSEPEEADLIIVNTCAFIGPAKSESLDTILSLARLKEEGRARGLIVGGCLAQRYPNELMAELPEVDAVVGTGDFPRIAAVAARVLAGSREVAVGNPVYRYDRPIRRIREASGPSAFVKVAEGCDHACAFCIIPTLRGHYRSRPVRDVVEEVRTLVAEGVVEVNLVSQDTAQYGRDLVGRSLLPDLLEALDGIRGLRWVRLLYNYPTKVTPALVEAVAGSEKTVPYFDIPFQHGSDRILRAMGRAGGRGDLLRVLDRIRRRIPEAVVRSTFIVGFPGESEEDFQMLLDFLRAARLDQAGFFVYSREEGTAAAEMEGQVAGRTANSRYRRAAAVQERISAARNRERIGRVLDVLVEEEEAAGVYRGRWWGQAPEVDGCVIFTGEGLQPGQVVPVRIEHAGPCELTGTAVALPAAGSGREP